MVSWRITSDGFSLTWKIELEFSKFDRNCIENVCAAVVLFTRVVILANQETLSDFHGDETKFRKKKIKMADSKKLRFSKPSILKIFLRKFLRLVLGLVGLNDAKGIDVAQCIWP